MKEALEQVSRSGKKRDRSLSTSHRLQIRKYEEPLPLDLKMMNKTTLQAAREPSFLDFRLQSSNPPLKKKQTKPGKTVSPFSLKEKHYSFYSAWHPEQKQTLIRSRENRPSEPFCDSGRYNTFRPSSFERKPPPFSLSNRKSPRQALTKKFRSTGRKEKLGSEIKMKEIENRRRPHSADKSSAFLLLRPRRQELEYNEFESYFLKIRAAHTTGGLSRLKQVFLENSKQRLHSF